ncbi:Plipastatin synthase subunit C [compost metagenome]
MLEAFEHPDAPFEQLVEALQPVRDTHRHPLFDVMLNYIDTAPRELCLPGVQAEAVASPACNPS